MLFVGGAVLPQTVWADPSVSLFLHQMKSTIINIISPRYSVSLSSLSATSVITFSSLCCCSQTDRAVQLLLETSADNPSYYCDSLKACLVTTITSSGPSQSTIKLVATNMIANGKLAGSVAVRLITVSDLLCSCFNECKQHSSCGCLQPWNSFK